MSFKKYSQMNVSKGSSIASLETGKLPDTPNEVIDQYLKDLKSSQLEWAQEISVSEIIKMLEEVLVNIDKYREEWTRLDMIARHVPEGHWAAHESPILGPVCTEIMIKDYLLTLRKIEKHGGQEPFSKARQDQDRVVIESFPRSHEDEQFLPGVKAEIRLKKGTKIEDLPSLQAKAYKDKSFKGAVALVLGAGNVSHLTLRDLFHKLLEERKVVVIKNNPTLEFMGPLMNQVLEPFIKRGFIRIVIGGAKEGHILATHPLIDEIIMTGSDKTFENIVYGPGEEGLKNKAMDKRINNKPIEGELGSVSPVIVVPGDWKEEDFEHYAELLLQMIIINNGYACLATRVIILPKGWDGSQKLLDKLIDKMGKTQLALNYYPGTNQTVNEALSCYPDALKFGELTETMQPLVFVTGLDPKEDEIAFVREFWMTFCAQVYVEGKDKAEFLRNAVKFANDKLWGTLTAAIFIDEESEKELKDSGDFQKAIDDLHYGNVTINLWPVITSVAGNNSEGGYPGATYNNIQSGNGVVRNSLMLDKIEKTVFFGPFRTSTS